MLNIMNVAATTRPIPALGVGRQEQVGQWTLATLVDILRRRIGTVVAFVFVALVFAAIYLAITPERFTATAVLIPDTKRTPPSPTDVSQDSVVDPAIVESQIETLKSEKVALAVIDKLALWQDPEFVGTGPGLLARAMTAVGLGGPDRPNTEEIKRRAAVGSFGRMLKVQRLGRSYVAEISFTSLDPEKAATIANAVAEAYIQDQLGAKLYNAERAGRWMQQRIAELRQQASDAQKEIEAFKASNNLQLDANGRTAGEREQQELAAALDRAREETGAARTRLERAQAALRAEGDRSALPDSGFLESLNGPKIASLRDEYRGILRDAPIRSFEEREPPSLAPEQAERLGQLRGAIWDEVQQAAAEAKTNYESALLREKSLARRVAEYAPQAEVNRRQRAQLAELEQKYQNYQQLHEVLQNRFARVSQFVQQQSLPVTEARVVTEATPPLQKSSPKTALILLLALCAGGTLGAGGAIGREYFDRTLRDPRQLERDLGLRWLGSLPRLSHSAARRSKPAANSDGHQLPARISRSALTAKAEHLLSGQAGEALRRVKLAVDDGLPSAHGHGRVVGIVSARAGAGKSTVALAAAMLLARAGKRTLLIDADLRDPALTRALVPGIDGGLVDVLMQQRSAAESIIRHGLGFHFIGQPAGPAAMHPSDLLGSHAMQAFLEQLRKGYNYIVIDTPALLEHVDVAASAGLFDALVMVAESGRTTIEEIEEALAPSHALSERLVGVVLNKTKQALAA